MRTKQETVDKDKLVNRVKLISVELLIVFIAFALAFITVVALVNEVFLEKEQHFDLQIFETLKPYVSGRMTSVMLFFTFFGSHYFLLPANILLIIYTFFVKADKWFAIRVFSVAITSVLLMFLLKQIFQRPRPLIPLLETASGFSFPSGHAFTSFTFFGILIYTANKRIKNTALKYSLMIFFFLFTILVGFSRIYLRVHYASDVIAGFCISLMWLVISMLIINRIEKNTTKLPFVNKA